MDSVDLEGGVLGKLSKLTYMGMYNDRTLETYLKVRLEFLIKKLFTAE